MLQKLRQMFGAPWTWLTSFGTRSVIGPVALLFALHLVAMIILLMTEGRVVPLVVAFLAWGFFNAAWILLLRRPLVAAGLTLAHLVLLILLSRFKHDILLMTVNFVDLMLIDADTLTFLLSIFPHLGAKAGLGIGLGLAALIGLWWLDPWRAHRLRAGKVTAACFAGMIGVAVAAPSDPWEEFYAENYFSKFVRSGVTVVSDLMTRGIFASDPSAVDRLAQPAATCSVEKPPHILFIHDESSFDARAIPGIKTPRGYGKHFVSSDGQRRVLLVEGAGGPSWYTEFNMLTGLSGRSFGRFIDFATRIAVDRVERGFPRALARCGYKTFTLYPMYGSFLSAKRFQMTAGIQHFLDSKDLGATFLDPDAFYFNKAVDEIAKHKAANSAQPLFMLVYTAQNHFPWSFRYRPDLAKDWRDLGNRADIDEYLRRQHLTATDYQALLERLRREFPDERFLIVRFGDHQPYFARSLIDPTQNDSMMVRRVAAADKRFLATYYTIEGLNFTPRETASALLELDAPYLPLVVLEAAGVPLDPSFVEQKKILQRCQGLFFRCNDGREARRFNRLLIDAGLIKGL